MRSDVEGDLTRTLQAVFEAAPPPAPAFPDAVHRTRRKRRRRRGAGLTGALAALLAITSFGVVTLRPGDTMVADFRQAMDVREVWPDAVVTLPARLSGTMEYTVQAALGGDTFLVQPDRGAPALLTGRTGMTEPLGAEFPDHAEIYDFDITDRYLFWSMPTGTGREIYARARHGRDEAVSLGHVPDTSVVVAESDGVIIAVGETKHGNDWSFRTYRLAAGQAPVPMPPDGYALADRGWAVLGEPRPGAANRMPRHWSRDILATPLTTPRRAPAYTNLFTDEQRTPVPLAEIISCTADACVGHDEGSLVSWDSDGTNRIESTGFTVNTGDDTDAFFSSDSRFVQVTTTTGPVAFQTVTSNHVWDLATGEVGAAYGEMAYDVLTLDSAGDKQVLDLTRIR